MDSAFITSRLIPIACADGEGSPQRSAVMILFRMGKLGWEILFTRRTLGLQRHQGQVSFPGGYWEQGDSSLLTTALRESEEEIGVNVSSIDVLGGLPPFETHYHRIVQPFVGILNARESLTRNPAEVARIFFVPYSFLAKPECVTWKQFLRPDGTETREPFFAEYDGEIIWGITGVILTRLLDRLV